MNKIKIFDTTLRDGEQAPGCSMNLQEKVKIAKQLERLKVDIIEAGFAISSPGDFESVHQIALAVKDSTVCSLARCTKKDIDAAYEALEGAASPRIHVFIATSPLHMEYKLKMTPDQVLARITESVGYAKSLMSDIEFSAEDASRSDREFLAKAVETAIKAGATTVNIPDTVGYAMPGEMQDLIEFLMVSVPGVDNIDISVHCHDDLGCAVANSLSSVKGGATQIECAVNGIGERAGNASLEEVVMAIKTRGAYFDADTGIDTKQLYRTSRLVSKTIGVSIPPNKAIVGANAFAHESGIHQHGVLANRETYEIMTPTSVGLSQNSMILGKHSGRHAFEDYLKSQGYNLTSEEVETAFAQFKELCDKKKEVTEFDIEALVAQDTSVKTAHYALKQFVINNGTNMKSTAVVVLKDKEGKELSGVAFGDGPIDAAFHTINRLIGMDLDLINLKINAVSRGEDALGEVTVKIAMGNRNVTGRGLSTDVVGSSILAYLNAVNKLLG